MRGHASLTVFYPEGDQVALNRSNVLALVFSPPTRPCSRHAFKGIFFSGLRGLLLN